MYTITSLSEKTIDQFMIDHPSKTIFNEESVSRITKAMACLKILLEKGYFEGFVHRGILEGILELEVKNIPLKSFIMIKKYQPGFIMTELIQHLIDLNNTILTTFASSLEELDSSFKTED